MAMSAEFRSKLELFTGNGDVSIWVKIFRMGRKTTNKRTNKQIYCSFSQLHCVNRENEFQTDGTRRVNRRNELQFGKANCVNRGKRNIYPWERFHNPKERIAQTSIWWFIFSGFFSFAHLIWKLKWGFLITCCPPVCPFVSISPLNKNKHLLESSFSSNMMVFNRVIALCTTAKLLYY